MLQANPSSTRIHSLSRKSTRKNWRVSRQCEIAEARHHGILQQICPLASRVAHEIHHTTPIWKWYKLISKEIYDGIEMVTREGVLHRGSTKFVEGEASANCSERLLIGCYIHNLTWTQNLMMWQREPSVLVWNKLSHQYYIFWKSGGRGGSGASTWSIG